MRTTSRILRTGTIMIFSVLLVGWLCSQALGAKKVYEINPGDYTDTYERDSGRVIEAYERLMDRYMGLVQNNMRTMVSNQDEITSQLGQINEKLDKIDERLARIEETLKVKQPAPPMEIPKPKPNPTQQTD